MKILLIGFGFVGKATYILNNKDAEFYIYDCVPELCSPPNLNLEETVKIVDIVFISLPTPTNIDGSCYTNLIDSYVKKLNHDFIVIRSTVPIGYCDSHNVFFMPEFLTELNWKEDFINNKHWLFGIYENCPEVKQNKFKIKICELITSAYTNKCIKYHDIQFGTNKEMEMNKLIRNTFLSTKVGYFNEIYDLTQKLNVNYNNVVRYVQLDDRIGNSHMSCPGYNNKRGYGGTCFPKDTNSLYSQLIHNNIDSYILQANLDRNENLDRPERDWLHDLNRTNVKDKSFCNVLVTGGAGFLGRNICKKLLEEPTSKVICMDNLITGKYSNIEEFVSNPNFKFVNFDIKNKIFLPQVDKIYHLACIASPDKYKKYSIETLVTSFTGTKNVLDLAKKHNAKLLFTSTSEVYGDPLVHPQPEEYFGNVNTVGERSCYDEGKRVAESLIYEYRNKFGLDLKIVRLFNTYGPYMDLNDGRVITNFINQIMKGGNLKIYGDGNQTRSFCYVDDMIGGLISMMESTESGPINLGNPNCEFTLNELVAVFEKVVSKKLNVDYSDATENDPKQRKPVITKARELLGFNPTVEIEEGIQKTMEFFKKL
jgi:UDP-glucuronate decarboxylase